MKKVLLVTAITASLLTGCATVPMESKEATEKAKAFEKPSAENAGLYIYRANGPGSALKKDVWVDDKCVGETAPNMFFYQLVKGGEEHKISTESEFSPNDLLLKVEGGENYFVKQYIKIGVFVGGADLKAVSKEEGEKAISKLALAKPGNCSK